MRKALLYASMVMALGLALSTPALAKNHDHYRGQHVRVLRGGNGHYRQYQRGVHYAPYSRPRGFSRLFFGFGVPLFASAPAYVYAPAPYAYGPAYGPPYGPYAYAPAPIVAGPSCAPVWVPGHYAWDGGLRFWVAGSWSRRR